MAENEDGSEKTEDATSKKMDDAKSKGNVARSRDLSSAALLIVAALSIYATGRLLASDLSRLFQFNFVIEREDAFDKARMVFHLYESSVGVIDSMVIMMAVIAVAGIIGSVGVGGMNFSWEPIAPKLSKLNPISGIKRMFSVQSLVELLKSVVKVLLVGSIATVVIMSYLPELLGLPFESIGNAVDHSTQVLVWAFIFVSLALVFIAAIDVPFQIWKHSNDLKMTKQEVKDEHKQAEGDPQVKGRIRQMQRQMAMNRMMSDVPKADVIITNPTHFSVALQYDPKSSAAPIMLAKGGDFIAMKIREIGNFYEIPVIQSPELTRAIYKHTEIGEEVPEGLFKVVAQLLAYVFQLKNAAKGEEHPGALPSFEIPEDYRWDGQ